MVIHCEPIRERNWKTNWKFKKLDESQNTCYILQLTLTPFTKHYFPNLQKWQWILAVKTQLLIHSHAVRFRAHQCFTPYYPKYKSIPHLILVIHIAYSDFFFFLGFMKQVFVQI